MLRAVALAAFLCLVAAAPAGAAVPRHWLGVMADGPLTDPGVDRASEWELLARSGARSVRLAFEWTRGQPTGPGGVDFAAYDPLVLAAAREDVALLPVVYATPEWARADPGNRASPPRDPQDYARFLTALVARYGPQGSFWGEHPEVRRRPIRAWQLWNEPNLSGFWSQQPFAPGYVRLLRAARVALRAADPGARAVLAGLPNGWDALRRIYRAGGRRSFDAVAIHPYTERPTRLRRFLTIVRGVMRAFGDRRKPIWVTELSWPASAGKLRDPIGIATDDRGQARRMRIGLMTLARARRRLRIERVYWYTWLSAESTSSVFDWSGLRRLRDGRIVSAPALKTFKAVARRLRR
jgi:hypothetical protein